MTPWSPVRNHPLVIAPSFALGSFSQPDLTLGPRAVYRVGCRCGFLAQCQTRLLR